MQQPSRRKQWAETRFWTTHLYEREVDWGWELLLPFRDPPGDTEPQTQHIDPAFTEQDTNTHNSGLMNFFTASKRAISYFLKRVDEQSKKCQQQKSTESNSPLLVMAVISLILACRWTCTQVRELSINISYRRRPFHRDTQHEYSSVPQHASPQQSLSLTCANSKAEKQPQPGALSATPLTHTRLNALTLGLLNGLLCVSLVTLLLYSWSLDQQQHTNVPKMTEKDWT